MNNRSTGRKLRMAMVLAMAPVAGALAAQAPLQIRPLAAAHVSSPAGTVYPPGNTRLIIKYRGTTNTSNTSKAVMASKASSASIDSARIQALVQSAARRAGIPARAGASASTRTSRALAATPLSVQVLRRQASGSQLLRIGRRLDAAELKRLLTELRADSTVEYAEPVRMLQPVRDLAAPARSAVRAGGQAATKAPNDPMYAGRQWHLQDVAGGIDAPGAWTTSTGKGAVVAVLDTGILPEHPDLNNGSHLLKGYDFITNKTVSRRDSDARVPGALDYGDWNDDANLCRQQEQSSWHGTHTAGTIGELTNNGIGGAGVAHDAQILPVRVLGRCGGSDADIADAIAWASGGHVDGVPDNKNPAEVISLSLGGGGGCGIEMQNAIDQAVANGSVVVVAAGNDASDASQYSPAGCKNVITVGATRITGGIAAYSNYGTAVDLAGPGGGGNQDSGNDGWDGYVLSTGYTGKTTPTSGKYAYVGMAGTSMATPHVAAVAALVQVAAIARGGQALTPAQIEQVLKDTAKPFPVAPPRKTPIGTGIVNAKAALDYLKRNCSGNTCRTPTTALADDVEVAGLHASAGDGMDFTFTAKAGTPLLLLSYGGQGRLVIYVKYGSSVSAKSYEYRSQRPGTTQAVKIAQPKAGTYHIKMVGGNGGFSNVRLMAHQ